MKNHAVIVLRNGNEVLFAQRSASKKSLPNIWAFPSGTVEEGEELEATIVREAKEELGVEVEILNPLAVLELSELNVKLHFIICRSKSGKASILEPQEIQALKYQTFEDFFREHDDSQIAHGLQYLKRNKKILKPYFDSV